MRLSDLDRQVLELVCALRVVTQIQLERLHCGVPGRTMRYRTRRLHQLGLLGRSRPYRDSGSAPHHLWPTRRADALVCCEPVPRRGERRAPNPLALAHSAAISELYVTLSVGLADTGLRLVGLDREADARETFTDPEGRHRAIAPDALIELCDRADRALVAHVEIDLGTMSHARLRTKLDGYLAYTQQHAWRHRHPYQPALLFITTGRQRADTFRRSAQRLMQTKRWAGRTHTLILGVCAQARHLAVMPSGRCWLGVADDQPVSLVELLTAARRPYDEQLAERDRQRREREDQRLRLTRDPEALREHLRSHTGLRHAISDQLTGPHAVALELLLDSNARADLDEHEALRDLGRQLEPWLPAAEYTTPTLGRLDPRSFAELAEHYHRTQRDLVKRVTADHGHGPRLAAAADRLARGELLGAVALRQLANDARSDQDTLAEQRQRRAHYLDIREHEARRRAREQRISTRIRQGPSAYLELVDADYLRDCPRCGEINYPKVRSPDSTSEHLPATTCWACGSSALDRSTGLRR